MNVEGIQQIQRNLTETLHELEYARANNQLDLATPSEIAETSRQLDIAIESTRLRMQIIYQIKAAGADYGEYTTRTAGHPTTRHCLPSSGEAVA